MRKYLFLATQPFPYFIVWSFSIFYLSFSFGYVRWAFFPPPLPHVIQDQICFTFVIISKVKFPVAKIYR